MISIAKTFEFCSSHRLYRPDWSLEQNLAVYGKCAHPNGHGHNFRLEVIVSGEVDQLTGMIIDAAELNAIVEECVMQELDHKHLNLDVPWLEGKIPTVEVIADAIWERLAPEIVRCKPRAFLKRIVLWETSRIYAVRE